jgi:hypothetical protein
VRDGVSRSEGRYRVRFVKAASSTSVEPRGVMTRRVGDESILIWRPSRDPLGDGCYGHFSNVGKGHAAIRKHYEANRHAGSWWSSYDIDGAFIFNECEIEVVEGPL